MQAAPRQSTLVLRLSHTTQEVDRKLREAIEQIVETFAGYGYRRVTHTLVRAGWSVNHKRVLRLMREESLLCRHKRRFVHTTDSHHRYHVYPNLLSGRSVEAPDTIWVADLTYIRLPSTFAYLACVLDAYSRKCVGWKVSKRIDAQLAVDALDMALAAREVGPGLIHHGDSWGPICQYCVCATARKRRGQGEYVVCGQSL